MNLSSFETFMTGMPEEQQMRATAWRVYLTDLLSRHKTALILAAVTGFFLGTLYH